VEVDFGKGVPPEAGGVRWALVLSNDTGNYYGRHYLVAPLVGPAPVAPVNLSACPPAMTAGQVDIGLLRVVDQARLVRPLRMMTASAPDLALVDQDLQRWVRDPR
jgi:mRNA-degrading endonuclease toxin of MazEF toxin-antitoxin module